ncbi:MAG: 4-(cytidine 5'-diphospho)-2-C-methyl-D-erythritol kinase, partial [Candidatus Limnocylindrales bacterium]
MTTTEVIARAKINLALAVTGRRADGYHDLRSVFVRVGVADRLSATVRPDGGDDDRLTIDGDAALSVTDNLVIRAVALLRDAFGGARPGLQLRLDKRIPVGSGMGGGSADAAAALDVAAATWGIALDADVRDRLAVRLGADVLFFARGHEAALVSGSGDEIRRLPPLPGNPGLLVVIPPFGITTAAVY